jgi:hypothetical protein
MLGAALVRDGAINLNFHINVIVQMELEDVMVKDVEFAQMVMLAGEVVMIVIRLESAGVVVVADLANFSFLKLI